MQTTGYVHCHDGEYSTLMSLCGFLLNSHSLECHKHTNPAVPQELAVQLCIEPKDIFVTQELLILRLFAYIAS